MPLTPAEVHNVAFKKPPIGKRGYDEEEVDAFLDIIEVELARLIEENNDLRSKGGSVDGAQAGDKAPQGDPAKDKALAAAREENERLQNRISEFERTMNQGKNGAQQQLVALQQQLAETEKHLTENRRQLEQSQAALAEAQKNAAAGAAAAEGSGSASEHHAQAVQMLALAQQTADQHLAQSKAEAERLVREAQASAANTISDANQKSTRQVSDAEARAKQLQEESTSRATQTVQDAEQRVATITAQFEQRRAALERRVEELRTFEREYRTRLKSYLESQLRDLDASGKGEAANQNEPANAQG
jgi:DivIVA domain-containing protein